MLVSDSRWNEPGARLPAASSAGRFGSAGLRFLMVVVLFASAEFPARAAKEVFQRTKPHVNVGTIGDVDVPGPPTSFSFFAELTLPEMLPMRFEALCGTVVPAEETGPGVIILLMALEGAPLRLGSLVVATVSPDAALPGCDIWDLMGGQVEGLPRFQFDAQGRISFRR